MEEITVEKIKERIRENLRRAREQPSAVDADKSARKSGPLLNNSISQNQVSTTSAVKINKIARRIPFFGYLIWWIYMIIKAPVKISQLFSKAGGLKDRDEALEDRDKALEDRDEALDSKISQLFSKAGGLKDRDEALEDRDEALDSKISQLFSEVEGLEKELERVSQHFRTTLRETLGLADTFKGSKAKAGLWFNEPIIIQYDNKGRPLWSGTNERVIEKAWVLRHMSDIPIGARILDVGCSESLLSVELASNGFQVTGIDIRPYPLKHPNFQFIQCDICDPDIESESYDAVIALSTIEHIGLGSYGDPRGNSSDRSAMKQIYRLLKPNGRLLITVPFGRRAQTSVQRIYDKESLIDLLRNFKLEKVEYAIKADARTWISPVPEEKALQQWDDNTPDLVSVVAMAVCIKK